MQHHLSWRVASSPFFADRLTNPLFELWLRKVVVIDPTFVARVVWRVNINALDPPACVGSSAFECDEVVTFDDQIAVEPGFLAFLEYRQLGVEFQRVVWNRVVIALNRGLSFKLQNWHSPSHRLPNLG